MTVDEAHNAKTNESFITLAQLNPAMTLELTATPVAGKANVPHQVSAQQLQAENMIKMPILRSEHKDGWKTAVLAVVQTRGALADAAVKKQVAGGGYIRPNVLFQATSENGDVPPKTVRAYSQQALMIAPDEIAVATGSSAAVDRRLVDKVEVLRHEACKARFKQAVRGEGWSLDMDWDAPFEFKSNAYPASAGSRYTGRCKFKRQHYGPTIADLKEVGEQFERAQMIDAHPGIKSRIRNLDFAPGFWLPTSRGKFYPDFVIERTEGRTVVVECEGRHLRSEPY